jgi:hypothetical protein
MDVREIFVSIKKHIVYVIVNQLLELQKYEKKA